MHWVGKSDTSQQNWWLKNLNIINTTHNQANKQINKRTDKERQIMRFCVCVCVFFFCLSAKAWQACARPLQASKAWQACSLFLSLFFSRFFQCVVEGLAWGLEDLQTFSIFFCLTRTTSKYSIAKFSFINIFSLLGGVCCVAPLPDQLLTSFVFGALLRANSSQPSPKARGFAGGNLIFSKPP